MPYQPLPHHPAQRYQHYHWMLYAYPPVALRSITEADLVAGFKIAHSENEDGCDMREFNYGILAAKTEAAALWLQVNAPQS